MLEARSSIPMPRQLPRRLVRWLTIAATACLWQMNCVDIAARVAVNSVFQGAGPFVIDLFVDEFLEEAGNP